MVEQIDNIFEKKIRIGSFFEFFAICISSFFVALFIYALLNYTGIYICFLSRSILSIFVLFLLAILTMFMSLNICVIEKIVILRVARFIATVALIFTLTGIVDVFTFNIYLDFDSCIGYTVFTAIVVLFYWIMLMLKFKYISTKGK